MPKTTAISVKGIPIELKRKFDIASKINGCTLTDCIIGLIEDYVKVNKDFIEAIEKERAKRAGKTVK